MDGFGDNVAGVLITVGIGCTCNNMGDGGTGAGGPPGVGGEVVDVVEFVLERDNADGGSGMVLYG